MREFEIERLLTAVAAAGVGEERSGGGIQLSLTQPEDPFMLAVYEAVRREEMAQWGWDETAAVSFIAMQYDMQQRSYAMHYPESKLFTVLIQGATVGKLHVADDLEAVTLVDVALLPQYQGQGLGTALVRGLQRYVQEARKPLRLTANAGSRASRLYEKLGFRILEANEVVSRMEWQETGY
ncbi:GNAT family N-acetyltransferase [Paenibacillus kobensis]|uniref:GNAT family N-acetyltransferase n=1 Tax=Paenibacillus kobensis TaxID=59841 RepID=UPI000FD946B0|nr:GNAT family N-acetyltransferase [Paenibacillus kobensis]